MNQFSERNTKNLLKKKGIKPVKRLGQNFLIDKTAIKKIIEAVNLNSNDIVLEIGPGSGALTKELAQKAKKVIAIEKDNKMIEILKETLKGFGNVEVIQEDVRKIQIPKLKIQNYKLVGNLPFYLTAPVIRQFLEAKNPAEEMILVVQKEVGQRICAKPPEMSILAVSVQFYAKPKIISYISKRAFWPSPKVDSAIIKISKKPSPSFQISRDLFFKIVKAGFSQPRKQLINNLSRGLNIERKKAEKWLLENKIQPSRRAETLNVEEWINLTKNF
jgi:16S rRNA (adenine1518-N6/adenine1519-N6)-dimethyltransferase